MAPINQSILAGIEINGGALFSGYVTLGEGLLESLPDDERKQLGNKARDFLEQLNHEMRLNHAKRTKSHLRQETIDRYLAAISSAGIDCSWCEIIPHGYSDDAYYWSTPWITAYTSIGPLTIGWRKRVIVLDWSKSLFTQLADELFPDENVTKREQIIHCWGYEKLDEYLGVLGKASTLVAELLANEDAS